MTSQSSAPADQAKQSKVLVEENTVSLELPSGPTTLPLGKLPGQLIEWVESGRRAMYQQIRDDSDNVSFFGQHLPVVVTYSPDSLFPFNCGNKGVGFLPKPELLEQYTTLYRETIEATHGKPWQESLPARIEAAGKFNFDRKAVDYRCLTSLEIFQKTTFNNLLRVPLASLLFTGTSPTYMSYQVNCAVEIIDENDPRFTFIKLSRIMFEYDRFHIAQPQFQYGYIFWVIDAIDKTPHRVHERRHGNDNRQALKKLHWNDDASDALADIPHWHRKKSCDQIEQYARQRGFITITASLVHEARKALRF